MTDATLADRRILVVGASSGIGAEFAKAAMADGARVVVSARRADRLEALCAGAGAGPGPGAGTPIAADATDPDQTAQMCARAAEVLGGFDLVFYTAGIGVLNPLAEFDIDTWRRVFDVNVMAPNLVCAAALPYVDQDGIVAFLSSRTVEDVNWGFLAYGASKAALDQSIKGWRVEHPDRRFVRVVMGNTGPTEFSDHMNEELIGPALLAWEQQAIPGGMMKTPTVGRALADVLAVSLAHPRIDSSEIKFDARLKPRVPPGYKSDAGAGEH